MKKKLLIQETGRQKILLFGSSGMLGHKILQSLYSDFLTIGTIRKKNNSYLVKYKLIKNIDINRIILIGGYHLDSDHSKSEEYVSKIKHFFEKHNYQVETRIDEHPDDDFILMSNSTYFIPSGGTFSMLISKMVEMNGKNVIN